MMARSDGLNKIKDIEGAENMVANYLAISQQSYPQYVDEIRGYASGAGVDFHDLFKLHVERELCQQTGDSPFNAEGCSSFMANTEKGVILLFQPDSLYSEPIYHVIWVEY